MESQSASAAPREAGKRGVEVLVVGGGPVGLFAAMELARHGVSAVRVVERKQTTTSESRALVTHARSLELLAHHPGLIDEYMRHGSVIKEFKFRLTDGSSLAKFSFLDADLDTKYALAAGVPQPDVERILEHYLRAKYGIAVEHGVEFVSVATKDDEVEVTVRNVASGATETIRASFLVACDGGRSPVRHALGLEFSGHPVPAVFFNVDVHIGTQYPGIARGDQGLVVIGKRHGFFVFPCASGGRARIFGPVDVPLPKRGEELPAPTLHDVQAIADARAPFLKATLHSPVWLSYFCSQQRKLDENDYRPHLRVFIAGDAAHVHLPIGGWGMNMGYQDVNNLCWKLAIHIKKPTALSIRGPLLNSYARERSPVAEKILSRTEAGLNFALGSSTTLQYYVRRIVLFFVFRIRPIRTAFARMATMNWIFYPDSPLHYASPRRRFLTFLMDMALSRPAPPTPGTRALDARITRPGGPDAAVDTRVYEAIFAPTTGFCFLQFAGADRSRDYNAQAALQAMIDDLQDRYQSTDFSFHVIWPPGTEEKIAVWNTWSVARNPEIKHWLDKTGEMFKRYGIATNFVLPRTVVVRPDRHIAGTFQDMGSDDAIAYFDRFLPR